MSAEPTVAGTRLRPGAISFVDALVIGLASTSPAYSLAAIIGPVVALVGVHAPVAGPLRGAAGGLNPGQRSSTTSPISDQPAPGSSW